MLEYVGRKSGCQQPLNEATRFLKDYKGTQNEPDEPAAAFMKQWLVATLRQNEAGQRTKSSQ